MRIVLSGLDDGRQCELPRRRTSRSLRSQRRLAPALVNQNFDLEVIILVAHFGALNSARCGFTRPQLRRSLTLCRARRVVQFERALTSRGLRGVHELDTTQSPA